MYILTVKCVCARKKTNSQLSSNCLCFMWSDLPQPLNGLRTTMEMMYYFLDRLRAAAFQAGARVNPGASPYLYIQHELHQATGIPQCGAHWYLTNSNALALTPFWNMITTTHIPSQTQRERHPYPSRSQHNMLTISDYSIATRFN